MKDTNRILFLEETHRVLDNEILRLEKSNPHSPAIHDLKKQKLKIKDEIEALRKAVTK